ncbi:MAG: hypothetical protein ACYDH9_10605 [Limisphaerales bacterium]
MRKLTRYSVLILIGISVAFGVGCRKNRVDTKLIDTALKQPGAVEVMTAIDKKDYDGAVSLLLKVKVTATNAEQQAQFSVLVFNAKTKLMDAAANDPKAADALSNLRLIGSGR